MLNEKLIKLIDENSKLIKNEVISIRRALHEIPELGDELPKTRKFILDELSKYNVEVRDNVGNNGIIALLRGGIKGKTVAYRADMDALPLNEENTFDFISKHENKMHACGHDGHIAIALSILKVLSTIQEDIKGNIKFIFQPAEETSGGALKMINDGALENPSVDNAFGIHIWPSIESGKIGLKRGPIMAGTDILNITITGKGGHGGIPHKAINPIVIGSKIINEITSIKSYLLPSNVNSVISICSIHSGEVNNVIPENASILGTVRTFSKETQDVIEENTEKIVSSICSLYGATYSYDYINNYPPTINDNNVISTIENILTNYNMQDKIFEVMEPSMGAEDFSQFLQRVPGAYIFVGTKNPAKGIINEIHDPRFNIDEDIFEDVTSVFCKLMLEFLEN